MKKKSSIPNLIIRGFLINILAVFIWIFILPGFVQGFVFELLSYFLGFYVIIIIIMSLKVEGFKDKIIFSYSSFSILIVFSIFLLTINFDNESLIIFPILLTMPIVISIISVLINNYIINILIKLLKVK